MGSPLFLLALMASSADPEVHRGCLNLLYAGIAAPGCPLRAGEAAAPSLGELFKKEI